MMSTYEQKREKKKRSRNGEGITMMVMEKGRNGSSPVPIEARLMDRRRIILNGEINSDLACQIVNQLLILNEDDPFAPIDLMINSNGGEIGAGLLIYDAMCSSAAPVRTICMQKAYSMAAVLFAAGTKRMMFPNSRLMIHEPIVMSQFVGNNESLKEVMTTLGENSQTLHAILMKLTGRSESEIEEACSKDRYFTLEEAIEFGLCDCKASLARLAEGEVEDDV